MYYPSQYAQRGRYTSLLITLPLIAVVLPPACSTIIMAKDYQQLWNRIDINDEPGVVQNLTEILVDDGKPDEAGRDFISRFGPEHVELYIEILDSVCQNLRLFCLFTI